MFLNSFSCTKNISRDKFPKQKYGLFLFSWCVSILMSNTLIHPVWMSKCTRTHNLWHFIIIYLSKQSHTKSRINSGSDNSTNNNTDWSNSFQTNCLNHFESVKKNKNFKWIFGESTEFFSILTKRENNLKNNQVVMFWNIFVLQRTRNKKREQKVDRFYFIDLIQSKCR